MSTIIIGIVTFGLLGMASISLIKGKKNNKGGCGCGCSGCPSQSQCKR